MFEVTSLGMLSLIEYKHLAWDEIRTHNISGTTCMIT